MARKAEVLLAFEAVHQWRLLFQHRGRPARASLASPLLLITINLALWYLIVLGFAWVY